MGPGSGFLIFTLFIFIIGFVVGWLLPSPQQRTLRNALKAELEKQKAELEKQISDLKSQVDKKSQGIITLTDTFSEENTKRKNESTSAHELLIEQLILLSSSTPAFFLWYVLPIGRDATFLLPLHCLIAICPALSFP